MERQKNGTDARTTMTLTGRDYKLHKTDEEEGNQVRLVRRRIVIISIYNIKIIVHHLTFHFPHKIKHR